MRYRPPGRLSMLALQAVLACTTAAPHVSFALASDSEVESARELAGRDPVAARANLVEIRRNAVAQGRLAVRLAADEAECRLLTDTDSSLAQQVAEAGLAEAARAPSHPDTQRAARRLAACGAGALLDIGQLERGSAQLDALISSTPQGAVDEPAVAMAYLERGLHRSRRGELITGQTDLLAACTALQRLALRLDLELCQWHLANHYKRVGDTDESLRLLEPLLHAARQRGATADASIYVYGLAQIRAERREWALGLAAFQEALALSQAAYDMNGVAYAEHGIAVTLHRMGRAQEALPHAERELALLADGSDPVQALRGTVARADLLTTLRRPAEAVHVLADVKDAVLKLKDDLLQLEWQRTDALAQAQLGHWEEAYRALDTAAALERTQHEQRLSEQGARLRMQFNRQRDTAELNALRDVDEQRRQLVQVQGLALGLFVALLVAATWLAARKLREARRLRRLAMVDELTGLPNRRAVLARLEEQRAIARRLQRPLSALMVDVDHFKSVNDTHGHAVGDQVLVHLAGLLQKCLRSRDWVGRLGGEEFLVVLPDASPEHAQTIAERMRETVAGTPFIGPSVTLLLTVSIGVAHDGETVPSWRQLVEHADRALYAAKSGGRNRVCVGAVEGASR